MEIRSPYRMQQAELRHRSELNLIESYREQTRRTKGGVVADLGGVTCYLNPDPAAVDFSGAFRSDPSTPVDVAVETAVDFFASHNHGFTLWAVGDDVDSDMDRAAQRRGLERIADRSIVYHDRPPKPPPGEGGEFQQLVDKVRLLQTQEATQLDESVTLRRVVGDRGRKAFVDVVAESFGGDRSTSAFETTYASLDAVCSPSIAATVGWLDGEPAGSSIVYVSHGVGCITWVGARPAARRRGLATFCTMAASALAFGMGADLVSGPASDVGAQVYEKLGAEGMTRHRWYLWTPG